MAAPDIVDAEALERDLRERVGDLGRGVEAERVGPGEIVLRLLQLLVRRSVGLEPRHLVRDDGEAFADALVLRRRVAPGHRGGAVADERGADTVGEAALLAHLLEEPRREGAP